MWLNRFANIIAILLAGLLCGCDPAGLRRVQLQLRPPSNQSSTIAIDSPDIRDALEVLDAVVARHGFKRAETDNNFARVYHFTRRRSGENGREHTRDIPCHARLTPTDFW